jgi:hypothetical protein
MNSDRPVNDILIGDDEWIEFVDLEGRYDLAVEIDDCLTPISDLLECLERHCVAECCGFAAYDFTKKWVLNVTADLDHENLRCRIDDVIAEVSQKESSVLMSTRMNNLADRSVFLQLLKHIRDAVPRTPAQPGSGGNA